MTALRATLTAITDGLAWTAPAITAAVLLYATTPHLVSLG